MSGRNYLTGGRGNSMAGEVVGGKRSYEWRQRELINGRRKKLLNGRQVAAPT
ncbi:MAG: hypothetical protein FWE01_01750 [Firmicutes bacterium]|nr:hypothetical protein [Bacillota bacterium]